MHYLRHFSGEAFSNKIKPAHQRKVSAFTLAEVLITLGIIGVVAAMTIPTLLANTQKTVMENKFKKAVATLSQAMYNGISEERLTPEEYDVDGFINYILPGLNVSIYCENGESACGLTDTTVLHGRDKGLALNSSNKRYVLSDGTLIGFRSGIGTSPGEFQIYVDLNGKTRPNRMGYDTFILGVRRNTYSGNFEFDHIASSEASAKRWFEQDGQGCDKTKKGSGRYCGARVLYDGFKINYW